MIERIDPSKIVYDKKFQGLCKAPFHGHPNGCPNYGKKEGCPPGIPLLDSVFDFNSEMFAIYTAFPVGEFADRMRLGHPKWSEHSRQWYNPRLWQGTARKEHRLEIENFMAQYSDFEIDRTPEGHGVNVTELMKNFGVELNWQWPPEHNLENKTYIVSLAGRRLND
jgi:hypothetical protein